MSEYVIDLTGVEVRTGVTGNDRIAALWGLPVREKLVRCRDCKYETDDGYGCKFFSHYEQGAYYQWEDVPAEVEPDGFCKWGERRTDA